MSSDGIRASLIILIFIVLNSIILTQISYTSIQNDWVNQRCNPLVIPFAGSFSPDGTTTSDNFSYCIQNTINSYSSVITQPYEYSQSMNTDAISSLSQSATTTQQQQQQTTDNMGSVTTGIYEIFLNIIIVFNVIILKLYDSQGKLSGVMVTIMNILNTLSNTGYSLWNGPPGQIMKSLSKIHV
jgi:hypothetical protein